MTVFFSFWNWSPGITHRGFPVVPCGGRSTKHKEHVAHDSSLLKGLSRLLAVNLGAGGPSPISVLGSGEGTVFEVSVAPPASLGVLNLVQVGMNGGRRRIMT